MSADDLSQLQQKIDYLMDRQAILDCVALHARGHDRHDADIITAAYHDDGYDEHGKAINPGPAYAAWINPVHAAGSQNHLHNITTHTVEIDGDTAHAESYVLVTLLNHDGADGAVHQWSLHRPARETRRRVADRSTPLDRRSDGLGGRIRPDGPALHRAGLSEGHAATGETCPMRDPYSWRRPHPSCGDAQTRSGRCGVAPC